MTSGIRVSISENAMYAFNTYIQIGSTSDKKQFPNLFSLYQLHDHNS